MNTEFEASPGIAALLATSPALYGETVSTGYLVTCLFKRDPFSEPVPWHATLQVDLEALPRSGRIVLNKTEQHVIYPFTPAALTKPAS